MEAYRIVDWIKNFEVDEKGHAIKTYEQLPPLEKLRRSPLPHIRITNTGHNLTTVDRRINEKAWIAGQMAEVAVFGLYIKLLRIAGNQAREFRGWILDERQRPLSAKGIADTLGIYEVSCVQWALGILTDPAVSLLEVREFSTKLCQSGQTPGDFRKSPEIPGCLLNETETERNRNKTKEGLPAKTGSASNLTTDFSASVSKAKQVAYLQLVSKIRPRNQSDATTLRDIVEQLEKGIIEDRFDLEIFNRMLDVIKDCCRAENRIAMFVAAMKEPPFNYVPERKRLTRTFF